MTKKLILFFVILFVAMGLSAEEYVFSGNDYVAKTGEGGDIRSLVVKGEEFVYNSYFYNNNVPFKKTLIKEDNKLIVQSELGTAVWEFLPDRIELNVDNISAINYFIVLDKRVETVYDDNFAAFPYVITMNKRLVRSKAAITATGDMKLWGPWDNGHSALDYFFMGNAGKIKETLTFGDITKEEFNMFYHIEDTFNIYSPVNYQVFQRESKDKGHIVFSGKAKENVTDIQYKIEGKDLRGKKVSTGWNKIKPDQYGSFYINREIKAGGWYTVTIKYKENGTEKIKVIDKVGVGEVIVGAGQSNSTNYGEVQTKTETGMVSATDGKYWRVANDPMIGVHDNSTGGSFYPALGDALYKEFNVPIGFAVTGHGGSSVEAWQPKADLFGGSGTENLWTWFMTRVYDLSPYGFRCIVWHQGESNATSDTDIIYNGMVNIISASRKGAGWDIPWFVAKVSYWNKANPLFQNPRDAHQRLWDNKVAFPGPDTDMLTSEYREANGEGVHFNEKGLKKHGEEWAKLLIPYIHSVID